MRVTNINLVLFVSILFCVCGDNNVVNNQHSLELTQSLNLARQELIQEKCNRYHLKWYLGNLPSSQLEHILIDDDRKLLYCYVPKVRWSRITSVFVIRQCYLLLGYLFIVINEFNFERSTFSYIYLSMVIFQVEPEGRNFALFVSKCSDKFI